MALEIVGSSPTTHPIFIVLFWRMRSLGRRQVVRHGTLTPAFAGPSPAVPANRLLQHARAFLVFRLLTGQYYRLTSRLSAAPSFLRARFSDGQSDCLPYPGSSRSRIKRQAKTAAWPKPRRPIRQAKQVSLIRFHISRPERQCRAPRSGSPSHQCVPA